MARSYSAGEGSGKGRYSDMSPEFQAEMARAQGREAQREPLRQAIRNALNERQAAYKSGSIADQNKAEENVAKAQQAFKDLEKKLKEGVAKGEPKADEKGYSAGEGKDPIEKLPDLNESSSGLSGGWLKNLSKDGKVKIEIGQLAKSALGNRYADDDVRQFAYEREGMSTSDAQAAVEAENSQFGEITKREQEDAVRYGLEAMKALQEMSKPFRFSAMTGAKEFTIKALPNGSAVVEFKLPTPKWGGKAAVIGIKYNRGRDTYGVYARSTVGNKGVRYAIPDDVYIDQLQEVLEDASGVDFSL